MSTATTQRTQPRRPGRSRRPNGRLGALPRSRRKLVRSVDGTRLHTEVFGPRDGYPIVLCHGITCAVRVWSNQIHDLSRDHRVIAFDHRGHGRSDVPRRGGYGLDLLAADLNAVLEATLGPRERAVIAGHSMGGIAITSWANHFPDRVQRRADAVALINTTTGDLLREVNLFRVPELLAATRIRVAHDIIHAAGSLPMPFGARWGSRRFITMMAVGAHADPAICDFVNDLFVTTPAAGRGGCARMLVDALGDKHLSLNALTVPALVIGSEKDRLLPVVASHRIAQEVPNLADYVELPGGHCANLEQPDEVNRLLRELAATAKTPRRAS